MSAYSTSYQLGARKRFNFTSEICWKDTKSIEGVIVYARDERTGEYVRVYECGPEEWVDNEPQSWSTGNFETVEAAKKWAGVAYRWINRGKTRR